MTRPRICFVLPSLHGGGAERAAVTLVNALDPGRFDLELCLFARRGAYLPDVAPHVAIREVGGGSRWRRIADLRRFFRATAPAIVMPFLSYVSVFAAVRRASRRIKFVINQQTPVSAFLDDRDFRWHEPVRRALFEGGVRAVYPRADLVVATSDGVGRDLVTRFGVEPARVAVVHNPFDVAALRRRAAEPIESGLSEAGDRIIVAAGRLADVKNVPLLIAAAARLASRLPIRVWILGRGDDEAALRRQAEDCGLADRVHWLGFQANPWRYIAKAHVFALTSRYEGFGNVLVEAMACGVPVVATASSGTREIVAHDVNGLLVERHEPDAVADALADVLERGRGAALAAAASAAVGGYDVPHVAGRYASLFEDLVRAA